ncbi:MAG: Tm-1-like ATP-binding domain-containing protein [Planctomycetes bacterium]|nr:Tm-1-like ATP-binding domain-containing protein [Planctomycetota bacterium]
MAKKKIAILATLDTKGAEAQFLKAQLKHLGSKALIVDLGVLGEPQCEADVGRKEVAKAGGTALAELQKAATREAAAPVMVAGATALLLKKVAAGKVHGVIGLGGLQGTAACCSVMRALPYGLPKVMVSTVASGDTSPYVGVSDITMMFSVGDILGLNAFMRKVLANAAGAAHGMAQVKVELNRGELGQRKRKAGEKPLIGISNLGVLTQGTMLAQELFAKAGYETIVFHAVGTGGRAMERMMRQGIIGAVFDYAMGEISDALFHGLRAGDATRLTVAGELGLPQVLVPGGSEHLGILVSVPNQLPDRWKDHKHVWHNPVVLAPRLNAEELKTVAVEIGKRLQATKGDAVLMLPKLGTGRYAMPGGPLNDPAGDAVYFETLKQGVPPTLEIVERELHAEDPAFVTEAVERLIALIEKQRGAGKAKGDAKKEGAARGRKAKGAKVKEPNAKTAADAGAPKAKGSGNDAKARAREA